MLMRTNLLILSCLVWVAAGCQMLQPLANPDSLDNASGRTWTITASFASDPRQPHDQAPEAFHDFGKKAQGPLPMLTQIVAVSMGPHPHAATFSLSARDLSKLRGASPGALMLVLYDGGIACLSPGIKRALEQVLANNPSNRQEYFRQLAVQEESALLWTRNALAR